MIEETFYVPIMDLKLLLNDTPHKEMNSRGEIKIDLKDINTQESYCNCLLSQINTNKLFCQYCQKPLSTFCVFIPMLEQCRMEYAECYCEKTKEPVSPLVEDDDWDTEEFDDDT